MKDLEDLISDILEPNKDQIIDYVCDSILEDMVLAICKIIKYSGDQEELFFEVKKVLLENKEKNVD